jgi:hypothetical protein
MSTSRLRITVATGCLSALTLLAFTESASAIIYKPSSLSFGKQKVKTASAIQQVDAGGGMCGPDYLNPEGYITPGPCTTEAADIAVSGPFIITSNTCPAQLASPNATASQFSCSIGVAFKPNATGPGKGFLRLTSSPTLVGLPLSGTGCKKQKVKGKKKLVCKKAKKRKKKRRKYGAA